MIFYFRFSFYSHKHSLLLTESFLSDWIQSDPEHGGVSDGVIYIMFPGSGPNPSDVLSSDKIDDIGRRLFTATGGSAD